MHILFRIADLVPSISLRHARTTTIEKLKRSAILVSTGGNGSKANQL